MTEHEKRKSIFLENLKIFIAFLQQTNVIDNKMR